MDINNKKNFKVILKNLSILYIEDEKNIQENMCKALEILIKKVYTTNNCMEAKQLLDTHNIDIIISDINLPKKSGIDFIKELREQSCYIPVILLTAYTDKEYLLQATKLKLVDYLIKPIDFNLLHNALQKAVMEIIESGKYSVNFEEHISYNIMHKKLFCSVTQEEIDLTAKEIHLLEYLIEHSNKVVSHEEIKAHIWEDSFEATDSALKNLLNKLRKKIGKNSIKNISGVGFRLHIV